MSLCSKYLNTCRMTLTIQSAHPHSWTLVRYMSKSLFQITNKKRSFWAYASHYPEYFDAYCIAYGSNTCLPTKNNINPSNSIFRLKATPHSFFITEHVIFVLSQYKPTVKPPMHKH